MASIRWLDPDGYDWRFEVVDPEDNLIKAVVHNGKTKVRTVTFNGLEDLEEKVQEMFEDQIIEDFDDVLLKIDEMGS